ncbi:MAG: 6-bladed beta-propeller, partial [Bacteroidales bacterium]|nr:6-bladed beta-propeller [Bacteroidales bacterium]
MRHLNYDHHILLLLTLTLFACGGKKSGDSVNGDSQNGLVTFHLNAPPSKVEPLLLSELADSVSYVALETTKETITKYGLRHGDRFYTISSGKLLCFDKNGVYLHQVGSPGRGPGEYIWYDFHLFSDFNYFTVDITTNWVYFFSDDHRTLVYDELGHFVKSL